MNDTLRPATERSLRRDAERLDFTRAFLPEALAQTARLACLSPIERLALNQIRGRGYFALFALVEEWVLPRLIAEARPRLCPDKDASEALLGLARASLAGYRQFLAEFERGFGSACEVAESPEAVARRLLSHDPLAVALVALHIEHVAAGHYLSHVRHERGLDPHYRRLLGHHWREDSPHGQLAALLVGALSAGRTEEQVLAAVDGYLGLGMCLDIGLEQQVRRDLASLERAISRLLASDERAEFVAAQHRAYRHTLLGPSVLLPAVLAPLRELSAAARASLREHAHSFGA